MQNDAEQMQLDFERYFLQKKEHVSKVLPVDKYPERKLIVIGNPKGRLLCKIKAVHLQPSKLSKKLQRNCKNSQNDDKNRNSETEKRFWEKRYYLFQKFDQGIKLDKQSWFSVTPEAVARYIAERIGGEDKTILDGFCGSGGDSIQLALKCKKVFANDLDEQKIHNLKNNAEIYKAANITPLTSNFMDLKFQKNQINVTYMSPPWGGMQYFEKLAIHPNELSPPLDQVIQQAFSISDNLVLLVPVNMDIEALAQTISQAVLGKKCLSCTMKVEKLYFLGRLKFLLVIFGKGVASVEEGAQLSYIYQTLGEGEYFKYRALIKNLRQKIGMVRILNQTFHCDNYLWKSKSCLFQKFEASLLHDSTIEQEELLRLKQLDQNFFLQKTKQDCKREKIVQKQKEGAQQERKERNIPEKIDSAQSESDH